MTGTDNAPLDELLDWLAEQVAARLRSKQDTVTGAAPDDALASGDYEEVSAPISDQEITTNPPSDTDQSEAAPPLPKDAADISTHDENALASVTGEPPAEPDLAEHVQESLVLPSHATRLMSRLVVALLVAVVLINLPLGKDGRALARAIPSSESLIVRNGLLVKESDKPDVYVYEDGKFHWITDLQAFEYYGYRWKDVHIVATGFLAAYETGRPIYLLAKCASSPHIYRLENGKKRWIVDIPTFEAEGYLWSDVQMFDCDSLSRMPMGVTIPPGRGPAPQP